MSDSTIYQKLLILEAHKRVLDEEDEIFEVMKKKYKQYEVAKIEFLDYYNLYTRLVSSALNISTIKNVSSKLENLIKPTNKIEVTESKEIIPFINKIVKCPYYCHLSLNTVNLLHQIILNSSIDKKLLCEIFNYAKENGYLKNRIDNMLKDKETDLQKCIPNLVDVLILYNEI